MRRLLIVSVLALSACNDTNLGSIGPDIAAPESVTFAPTASGEQDSQTVILRNAGGGTLTIQSLDIASSFSVEGAASLPISLEAQEELLIQVVFAPNGAGPHDGVLTVYSNDVDEPQVDIALLTTITIPDIALSPSPVLAFGTVSTGTTSTLPVTISNVGSAPLEVSGATFGAGSSQSFSISTSFPLTIAAGGSFDLPVTFTPGTAGGHGGSLHIASNDPDEATKVLGLTGTGDGSAIPDIAAAPASVAFGQVVRFTCSTVSVAISNPGSGTLTVTNVARAPGTSTEYTATPTAFTVNPGSTQSLAVTFCPTNVGFDNGSLEITSNDPDENPFVLPLSGEGIPPPVGNASTDIAIEVIWSTNDTDVDTHLIRAGGSFGVSPGDCYYANLNPDWGVAGVTNDNPFLDHDDVDGFGPENLNLALARTGSYRTAIYYFSDHGNGPTSVTVRVYLNGVLSYTNTRTLSHHQRWDVVDVMWNETTDSGTMTVLDSVIQMFTLAPQTK